MFNFRRSSIFEKIDPNIFPRVILKNVRCQKMFDFSQISIFEKIFDFLTKFLFLMKISIFTNVDF